MAKSAKIVSFLHCCNRYLFYLPGTAVGREDFVRNSTVPVDLFLLSKIPRQRESSFAAILETGSLIAIREAYVLQANSQSTCMHEKRILPQVLRYDSRTTHAFPSDTTPLSQRHFLRPLFRILPTVPHTEGANCLQYGKV